MSLPNVVIIDTGCANLTSVKFAFERLNCPIQVSDKIEDITAADKLILPGVGAAAAAMKSLHQKGLVETIQNSQQPLLGICLGMQLLVETSSETSSSAVNCLNLISDKVTPLDAKGRRVPHMGWNTLSLQQSSVLFDGIDQNDYFYFVHSFAIPVGKHTLASCEYGSDFSASIQRDNFYGVQFHPERSGKSGAKLLKNFVEKI